MRVVSTLSSETTFFPSSSHNIFHNGTIVTSRCTVFMSYYIFLGLGFTDITTTGRKAKSSS